MIRKGLKWLGRAILLVTIGVVVGGLAFLQFSPQFGGSPTENEKEYYKTVANYDGKIFENNSPTSLDMSMGNMWSIMKEYQKGIKNQEPSFNIPVHEAQMDDWATRHPNKTRFLWFGHSAVLVEMEGKRILIDPMLGESPSPIPALGASRYSDHLPVEIENLPEIDIILISHDHYDHLDYPSIAELKDKTNMFLVPLGIAAHLRRWGIPSDKIQEFHWWEEAEYESIQFALTPSRHFSGRGLTDNSATLWGSWVITGKHTNVYFSGDGGYDTHFTEIGEKYGPFDLAFTECGQYNERWSLIHMMPEQSVQAAIDVKAKIAMPIHWGAFTLALHSWTDPIERFVNEAHNLQQPYIAPVIGDWIVVNAERKGDGPWWFGN